MSDSPLPPVCQAPSCRENALLKFMGMTPLCRWHGAKANRRAATNVLFVGIGLALFGAALMTFGRSTAHLVICGAIVGSGAIVTCTTFWYRHSAARLEAGG